MIAHSALSNRSAKAASVADGYLVTGSTGFLGGRLVAKLESQGSRVIRISQSLGIDLTRDDLPLDGVNHVFHLAARTGTAEAWRDPVGFFSTNALGTLRVVEQCRRQGCSVTFLSSFLYAADLAVPAKETDPVSPQNPYSLSKLAAEQICAFYAKRYGLKVVTLRLANIYGPGQRPAFIVPHIVSQVVDESVECIEVLDLSPKRDLLYVDDAVDGIMMAASAPPGSLFNLGSGHGYSVDELIRRALAVSGVDKPYRQTGERRPSDLAQAVADVSAIREALGWRPTTSLDAGLRAVVEDMRHRCRK